MIKKAFNTTTNFLKKTKYSIDILLSNIKSNIALKKQLLIHNAETRCVEGISSIELILILLVLVSVVVVFKSKITGIVNSVFKKISDAVNEF